METQTKTSAKDFFINLGAMVALYTTVVSLLNLLFTVINVAYPQITTYYYGSSQSISMPVATLIIFFPIFILLMWLMERVYKVEPEKKHIGVRKWLTYITLFVAGLTLAGDLVTVLYYFIDGQELTTGFLLKVFAVFVVILVVFLYYISDIRNKLTPVSRKIWLGVSLLVILGSVVWGFAVLGSPRTQQLLKYDQQKVSDLQNMNNEIINYYQRKGSLPDSYTTDTIVDYIVQPKDPQTSKLYKYNKTSETTYNLCAEFNKDSNDKNVPLNPVYTYPNNGVTTWLHPAGYYCFTETIPVSQYKNPPVVYPLQ
jgi:hypothetical protein